MDKVYICKSKLLPSGKCTFNCEVKTPFEPRGCLYTFIAQNWVEKPLPISTNKIK